MFDRAWMILCRDASQPVGTVRMLRATPDQARARIERGRDNAIVCTAPDACTVKGSGIAWTTRIETDRDTRYAAQGSAAYDAAMPLALDTPRRRPFLPEIARAPRREGGSQYV